LYVGSGLSIANMSKDPRCSKVEQANPDDETRDLQAHREAVEDALHQADYVRRFVEYVSLYATSETRIESLFRPAGMTRN
jgi:hypothetical protein